MKNIGFRVLAFSTALFSFECIADDLLFEIDESYYPRNIDFIDVRDAYLNSGFEYASLLVAQYVYFEHGDKIREKAIDHTIDLLDKYLNAPENSGMTQEEIRLAMYEEVIKSIHNNSSSKIGDLELKAQYSFQYGATVLTWNQMIEIDECRTYAVGVTCDPNRCEGYNIEAEYYKDYVYKQPTYEIYRVVGDREELVTNLRGFRSISREGFSISPDLEWSNVLKSLWNIYSTEVLSMPSIDGSRAFWVDYSSGLHSAGKPLGYRVVSDNKDFRMGDCGSSERYSSTLLVDSDGDGKMDYVDPLKYRVEQSRVYTKIMPSINLVLD